MKLAEVDTKQGMQMLTRLAPHVAKITRDEELVKILQRTMEMPKDKSTTKMAMFTAGMEKIAEIVPILFDKQADETVEIVAIISGKTAAQIYKQPFKETLKETIEIFNDKDILDFFSSFMRTAGSE